MKYAKYRCADCGGIWINYRKPPGGLVDAIDITCFCSDPGGRQLIWTGDHFVFGLYYFAEQENY